MNKLLIIFVAGILGACSSSTEEEVGEKVEVTPETTEKVKKAQDANVELELIDGELDSLIITVK